jgi:hypothetical protein
MQPVWQTGLSSSRGATRRAAEKARSRKLHESLEFRTTLSVGYPPRAIILPLGLDMVDSMETMY